MVSNLQTSSDFNIIEKTMVVEEQERPRPPLQKRRPKRPRAKWGTLGLPKRVRNEDDIYNYEYRLNNAFSHLSRSEKISPHDKELIKQFYTRILQAQGVSIGRRAKYLLHLKTIVENLGVEFESAKRENIENFMAWLNSQKYSPYTRVDYITFLKRFYKFIRTGTVDKEEPFPLVRWLRKTIKPNERKQPEFLTPLEVKSMIGAADRLRDKAMLSVGYEAGLRATELLLLNIGDISFDERGGKGDCKIWQDWGTTSEINFFSRYSFLVSFKPSETQ
ncbi:MAG: tyrosine-type recombinase/integrase [archaeon]|nr:tyrosine-type recombinase/integrase [archaeon]